MPPADTAPNRGGGPEVKIPLRMRIAVYGVATFSFSMLIMVNVVMPLWVVTLGASPLMVGIVLGSRHFLTLLFSIHGGALMDRLGIRRVMLGFAFIAVVAPLLIPLAPWIAALIVLQMIGGFSDSIGWMGAQTVTGKLLKGDPDFIGRMSFFIRLGAFGGPLLVGWAWDVLGPWGAFGAMSLWSACGFACTVMLPVAAESAAARQGIRVRLYDLLPRWSDYVAALRLSGIAAVALVLMATVLRLGGTGIQGSFYVVYLGEIGLSGAEIGLLLAVSGLCAGASSLLVGRIAKIFSPNWLMLFAVGVTIALISITPLLGSILLLTIVSGLRGAFLGIAQPLEISLLGRTLAGESQGKGVGLRTTANRLANLLIPVVMGAVAELAGIGNSFYIVGGGILFLLGLVVVFVARTPALHQTP